MPALLEVGTGLRSIRSSIDVAVYVMVDRRSFSCNNNPSSRHTVEDRAHHAWLVVVGAAAVSPPRSFPATLVLLIAASFLAGCATAEELYTPLRNQIFCPAPPRTPGSST